MEGSIVNKSVFIAVLTLIITSTAYAAPPTKNVNIVNTPTVNVSGPVNANITGTLDTNIVNTPTVNANINGPVETNVNGTVNTNVVNTPDVNVLSMPPVDVTLPSTLDVNVQNMPGVTIENSDLNPVPVTTKTYAREPFRHLNVYTIPSGSLNLGTTLISTVPNNKRLVIEHISARYITGVGNQPHSWVVSLSDNTGPRTYADITMTEQVNDASSTERKFAANEPVRLYGEPGERLTFNVVRNSANSNDGLTFSVSGYYVPIDSPSLAP